MRPFGTAPLIATSIITALFIPASSAMSGPPQGRLPDDAMPEAYRVDLTVDPAKDRFSGHVEIDVTTKATSRSLWINGRNLHVVSVAARAAGKTIPGSYVQVDPLGLAKLDFTQPLPAGKVTLTLDYDAPFGTGPAGLYHAQVDGKWYAWTQFESIEARSAYPSFDQPGYKTPFAVTLTTKSGLVAVSNAEETARTKVAGGMERHVFAATKPLPTYLTAFMVGPFATMKGQVAQTPERSTPLPVRIVATQPNQQAMFFALINTAPIVRELEHYFGQAFPFPKLDQIASPSAPGAMENAGADTYPEQVLLLGEKPSTGQLRDFGVTVSHELSHQWFGDLVTPAWWSDIWLNESFANWMGYRIGNEWRPDLKLGGGAVQDAFAAMDLDALTAGRPIHQAIATTGEIASAFDAITYGKGGQVIAMIASYMGDVDFQKGVRLHLSRHAYGTATTDDFFQSLADAEQDPRISAALRSFVDQQGVPLVTVRRSGSSLILTQAPYALLGTKPAARSWIIPFCYSVGGKRSCVMMDKPTMTVAIEGTGPILPNSGGTGYYRFSLDDADWLALIGAAATAPPGDALATTDSLWAAFKAGDASPKLLVAEAKALLANPYSVAATNPGRRFRSLAELGLIDQGAMPAYRRMIHRLYASRLAAMGFDPSAGAYAADDTDRQRLRAQLVDLVGLDAKDPHVQKRLADAASSWLGGDSKALDKGFFPSAFDAYLEVGGLAAAQNLFERAVGGDDPYLRAVAMDVIARSGDAGIAGWLIEQLDDKRLRASEKTRSVRLLMANATTRELGYLALLARFNELAKGSFGGASDLMADPAGFCSNDAATRIERDLQPKVAQYKISSINLDRTIEQVRDCGLLQRAEGNELAKVLH